MYITVSWNPKSTEEKWKKCSFQNISILAFLDNGLWKFQTEISIQFRQKGNWNQQSMHCKGYLENNSPKERRKSENEFSKFGPVGFEPTHIPDKGLTC